MAEEEVAAVVADNGSGTCNTEFAGDEQHGWTCPQPARVQVFDANAWICAPQATDRDLEGVST